MEWDIYSIGYVINAILKIINIEATNPKRDFAKHVDNVCSKATTKEASTRPKAYKFVMCMVES